MSQVMVGKGEDDGFYEFGAQNGSYKLQSSMRYGGYEAPCLQDFYLFMCGGGAQDLLQVLEPRNWSSPAGRPVSHISQVVPVALRDADAMENGGPVGMGDVRLGKFEG